MKNIKSIALSALMITAAFTPTVHAHPLEKLMPFVTRILLNSKSYLEYAPGLWIKKLAEPYGLKCQYPVLVKQIENNATKIGYVTAAHAVTNHNDTDIKPKLDQLGRVILDITDETLVTGDNQHIVFNRPMVEKYRHNPALLAAILFHETKHLDENHGKKMATIENQAQYALKNNLPMVLSNGVEVDQHNFLKTVKPGLRLLYEEEADSSLKEHPRLCHARNTRRSLFNCLKVDLRQFRYGPKFDLYCYRRACLGDREAYEYLEQKYACTHPLAIRRRQYFLEWANDAEKNQTKKHPNLNDAWLDYCRRHIPRKSNSEKEIEKLF